MDSQELSKQVKRFIVEAKLEKAANALITFFDQKMSPANKKQLQLYNQTIYQLSKLNELKEAELTGVISTQDAELKRNKIRAALLEISERLEEVPATHQIKTRQNEAQSGAGNSPPPNNKSGKKWIITVSVLAILGLGIWSVIPDPSPEGCYIIPGGLCYLLSAPSSNAGKIGTLESGEDYEVIEIKAVRPAPDLRVEPTLFFKVNGGDLGDGWVKESLHIKHIDRSCYGLADSKKVRKKTCADISGCCIETSRFTFLLDDASLFANEVMELPDETPFRVLNKRKVFHAGHPTWFFEIEIDGRKGWVKQDGLKFTDPTCLQ